MEQSNVFNGFKSFVDLSLPVPEDPKTWFKDLNKVLEDPLYPINSEESVCQRIAGYITAMENDPRDRKKIFQRMLLVIKNFQREFLWLTAIPQLISIDNKQQILKINNINLFYSGVLDFLSKQQEDEEVSREVKSMMEAQSCLFAPTFPANYFFRSRKIAQDLPMQVTLYLAYLEKLPKIFPELTKVAGDAKEELQETADQIWQEIRAILSLIGVDFKLSPLSPKFIEESLIFLLKDCAEEGHFLMPRSAVLRPMGLLAENLAAFLKPSLENESSVPIFPTLINKYNQLVQQCNLSLRDKEKLTLFKGLPKYSFPGVKLSPFVLLAITICSMFLVLLNPVLLTLSVGIVILTGGIVFLEDNNMFLKGNSKALVHLLKSHEHNRAETSKDLKQTIQASRDDLQDKQIKQISPQKQYERFNLSEEGFLGRMKSMSAEAPVREEALRYKRSN